MQGRYYLGVDLGGTNIQAVLISESGQVLSKYHAPTRAKDGVDAVVSRLCSAAEQAAISAGIPLSQVERLGVGCPGPVNPATGIVTAPPNLPGWDIVPLAQLLKQRLQLPVHLDNDANAAAWGEYLFGAGQGCQEMLFLTISTGIGAGIISGGRLIHGYSGGAAEVGHMVLNPKGPLCGCGNRGCWEALCSGTALARQALEKLAEVPCGAEGSLISKLAGDGPILAEHVFSAAKMGDNLASEVLSEAIEHLGIGLVNLVNLLNPARIVIGGGVAQQGEVILAPLRHKVESLALEPAKRVDIMLARLGSIAGAVGAAALARSKP